MQSFRGLHLALIPRAAGSQELIIELLEQRCEEYRQLSEQQRLLLLKLATDSGKAAPCNVSRADLPSCTPRRPAAEPQMRVCRCWSLIAGRRSAAQVLTGARLPAAPPPSCVHAGLELRRRQQAGVPRVLALQQGGRLPVRPPDLREVRAASGQLPGVQVRCGAQVQGRRCRGAAAGAPACLVCQPRQRCLQAIWYGMAWR